MVETPGSYAENPEQVIREFAPGTPTILFGRAGRD